MRQFFFPFLTEVFLPEAALAEYREIDSIYLYLLAASHGVCHPSIYQGQMETSLTRRR